MPRKKCILTKGQWGIRLKSSYLATKPHVIFAGYIYTGGVSYGTRTTPELIEQQKVKSVEHAKKLIKLLETL